jgi:hypothetical protein
LFADRRLVRSKEKNRSRLEEKDMQTRISKIVPIGAAVAVLSVMPYLVGRPASPYRVTKRKL